jgi:hypothetical protein
MICLVVYLQQTCWLPACAATGGGVNTCFQPQALCAMHKLPQRMLDQLLKPQAQHSTVAGAAALQRSGLPALLRDALQAAFNKSQARPCLAAGASTLLLLACTVHTTYANSQLVSLRRWRPLQSLSWAASHSRWCRSGLELCPALCPAAQSLFCLHLRPCSFSGKATVICVCIRRGHPAQGRHPAPLASSLHL